MAQAVDGPNQFPGIRVVAIHPTRHHQNELVSTAHMGENRRAPGTPILAIRAFFSIAAFRRFFGFPDLLTRLQIKGGDEFAFSRTGMQDDGSLVNNGRRPVAPHMSELTQVLRPQFFSVHVIAVESGRTMPHHHALTVGNGR